MYDSIGKLHSFRHAKRGVLFVDDNCHANIVTSIDDTFLTNVGAHFSVDQSGLVQHEVDQSGWVQHEVDQSGWVQHEVDQSGWVQHEVDQSGWVQHEVDQSGWVQHEVDQSGWVQHEVGEHSVCAGNPSPTLRSSYSPGSWRGLTTNMKANNMAISSWCCKMSFAWTWTVPGGCCLLVSPVESRNC